MSVCDYKLYQVTWKSSLERYTEFVVLLKLQTKNMGILNLLIKSWEMSTTENHPGEGDGSLKILNKYLPTKCIYTYMCIYMKSYTEYNIHFYVTQKNKLEK